MERAASTEVSKEKKLKWNKEAKNKLRGGLDGSGKRFKKNQLKNFDKNWSRH